MFFQRKNRKNQHRKKKSKIKTIIATALSAVLVAGVLAGCGASGGSKSDTIKISYGDTYTIGICNSADDASLSEIVPNIRSRLNELGGENGVTFVFNENSYSAGAGDMDQIIAGFTEEKVDLMVGVTLDVAKGMQAATQENQIPVVFAAVSDPLGSGLVESLRVPGANITGTSDRFDASAVLDLIFAVSPDAELIGLLYDAKEDSSAAPVAAAKAYLDAKGVSYVERTGATSDEIMLAAEALVDDGADAVFTPAGDTIMTAEFSIYGTFAEAGVPHYTGAEGFAPGGAFLGCGVDYAALGRETADMIYDVLVNGTDISRIPVRTAGSGVATVNTETCAALGFDYDEIAATLAPYCTKVRPVATAVNVDDPEG